MAFATDRKDKMFTAANLNDLYSRFDQKCYLALNGKSPLFAKSVSWLATQPYYGTWNGAYPYGVWYVYRNDPASCKRLRSENALGPGYIPGIGYNWRDNHQQIDTKIQLSKLENKHIDVSGGQVYVDHWVAGGDPFTCDVAAIHYSFELLTREIGGIKYDIHLGWDAPAASGLTSYVRGSLGAAIDPTLPPGRIHKHRLAVAEIATEEISEFKILNTYQRYDCWRVHACGKSGCTVFLQLPDGSAEKHLVDRGSCRSFRRRPDGTWASSFPGGGVCRYFFPYFIGDIPFLAEGPPGWSFTATQSEFLTLERSAQANNVANPFILFEWRKVMGAMHDPFTPYDIRQVYTGVYADPVNANTIVGDAAFTWGRAVVHYININHDVYRAEIVKFTDASTLPDSLRSLGIDVNVTDTNLELTTNLGEIRIYPLDANIFTTELNPFWSIDSNVTTISTIYPSSYTTSGTNSVSLVVTGSNNAIYWSANNAPTIFDTISDLRRKVAVEAGFLNVYTDTTLIEENKVSTITMTPLGLTCQVGQPYFNIGSLLNNVESNATNFSLYLRDRQIGYGVGPWASDFFSSGCETYYLSAPITYPRKKWENIFPGIRSDPFVNTTLPAVNTAYIPPGGPWGFSSSVYDFEQVRAYNIDLTSGTDDRPWGADFWINKWGGPNGSDASVRLPGSPNKTEQYAYVPTAPNSSFVDLVAAGKDDIFKDSLKASFASSVTLPLGNYIPPYRDNMTQICWTGPIELSQFYLPYASIKNPYRPGGGPFFHKISKSAWLWNLLEWSVNSWTRAEPLCHGQTSCPLRDATGSFNVVGVLTINMVLLGTSGVEFGGPGFYITEGAYDLLIANGITCYRDQDSGGNDYWHVPAVNLATYCNTQGFTAWNFDSENGQPNASPPIAATGYISKRLYGPGEQRQSASYYDVTTSTTRYESLRYVNLRLGNELVGNPTQS